MQTFKTTLLRYSLLLAVLVTAFEALYYLSSGTQNITYLVILIGSALSLTVANLAFIAKKTTLKQTALAALLVFMILIATANIFHALDTLQPTWFLVIVLFSYLFFSRRMSLMIMILIYVYFVLYAFQFQPGVYNIKEILTLTASLFITAALCSKASIETEDIFKKLSTAAYTDPMTQLWNRRGLEKLFFELVTNDETQSPYSVAIIDLDNFKQVNDKLGHVAGDKIIQLVGKVIKDVTREHDITTRLGGEEFLLVLPNAKVGRLRQIVDRLRDKFQTEVLALDIRDHNVSITLSAGICEVVPAEVPLASAMELADELMYSAKAQGRNRVLSAQYNSVEQTAKMNHSDTNFQSKCGGKNAEA